MDGECEQWDVTVTVATRDEAKACVRALAAELSGLQPHYTPPLIIQRSGLVSATVALWKPDGVFAGMSIIEARKVARLKP